jgi:hypothetical protein
LSSIISVCVEPICGHWLVFDVLNATITMSLKLKEEFEISSNLQDLIDDDFVVAQELSLFASSTRRKV